MHRSDKETLSEVDMSLPSVERPLAITDEILAQSGYNQLDYSQLEPDDEQDLINSINEKETIKNETDGDDGAFEDDNDMCTCCHGNICSRCASKYYSK